MPLSLEGLAPFLLGLARVEDTESEVNSGIRYDFYLVGALRCQLQL